MTPPTNWPDPARPGYPMFPERGGWHILIDGGQCACYWHPDTSIWWNESKRIYISLDDISEKIGRIEYIGPVLTPTQITEMLAGERERCADVCRAMSFDNVYEKTARVTLEVADMTIRNLGAAS